jgi:hypothetical protein
MSENKKENLDTFFTVLKKVGFTISSIEELQNMEGFLIPRECLLYKGDYDEIANLVPELKKKFSSTRLTSLHKNAIVNQKWPLLNLLRQILNVYGFYMKPLRKSNGYDENGVKQYERFFLIERKKDESIIELV